ncbi:hypothetical protein HYDPIDRAFT_171253 [Hydnomerulius pinastri MD-312]|uniref:Unplaced genomic scaffold scaffold_99, whole genome shotgun sequence n=1 Tax=Hydnomerulius pinastri MD-312 TaxID=994086 RepID=A0A0C9W6S6_9AGAM|nr:hypothetical protein HYDPIDRAFT_171253 [Hydnomerulius pinastri MD-312]
MSREVFYSALSLASLDSDSRGATPDAAYMTPASSPQHHSGSRPYEEAEEEVIVLPDDYIPPPARCKELWYQDGNIILEIDRSRFRVHRSILSRKSRGFANLFECIETRRNVPIVQLEGDAEEMKHLLLTLYETSYLERHAHLYEYVSVLLRLSTRYQFPDLRREAIARIKQWYPNTLEGFDNPKSISLRDDAEENAIAAINLAREANCLEMLPAAFYFCSRLPLSIIMRGDDLATLNATDIVTCLRGRARLLQRQKEKTHFFLYHMPPDAPYHGREKWCTKDRCVEGGCAYRFLPYLQKQDLATPCTLELFTRWEVVGHCPKCPVPKAKMHEVARKEPIPRASGDLYGFSEVLYRHMYLHTECRVQQYCFHWHVSDFDVTDITRLERASFVNPDDVDGPVIVWLDDAPEAIQELLKTFREPKYFDVNAHSVSYISAILLLSTKYEITELWLKATRHLEFGLPSTLEIFDNPIYVEHRKFAEENAIELVNLARQIGLLEILPCALYYCARLPIDTILDGKGANTLSAADVLACLLGKEQLLKLQREKTHPFIWQAPKPNIKDRRTRRCTDGTCVCGGQHGKFLKYLQEKDLSTPFPLELFDQWHIVGRCVYCAAHLIVAHQEARESVWKDLPAVFGLGSWEDHWSYSTPKVTKLLGESTGLFGDLESLVLSHRLFGFACTATNYTLNGSQPAPEDEFITKGGRKAGPEETPILEAKVPGTDTTVEQHPHADDAKVTTGDGEEKSGSQALREGQNATQDIQNRYAGAKEDVKGQAYQTVQGAKDSAQQQADQAQQQGTLEGVGPDTSSEEVEAKKQGFKDRIKGVRDGISDRLPQQHKDRANEHFERGRKFLAEEYFPEERRDQFIYRGKKVIIECQKHDDYQDAMKWLLSFAEEYAGHGQTMTGKGKESGGAITGDPALRQSTSELRQLLERFANEKSMNGIFDAANALIDDARRDEEFRSWFKRLDTFIRKLLLEAGYVLEDDCNREGREIRESGRTFWDEKYRGHFDNLFNSIGDWFSAMGEDPLNKRFGEDWARLTRDLLFDSEGSLKFKPDLWSDIRKVIVPTLVDKLQIGYVPIPRVEYTDDALDLVVENLTLQGRNLFPNFMSLEAHNFLKFSPYNAISDEHHHEFTLTFGQMQADMRDVAFYFRRKSGFPKVADSGLADVLLGGSGLTATVHLVSADKDRSSVFKVKNVHVKVDTLKFSIRDSKHDLLYKTLKPLATGLVKRQIQKAIADAITTGMEYVDGQLVAVRDRMEEAKTSEEANRKQVLQDLFKRQKEEQKEHSIRTTESKSQFKVVHNKRASIIDTGHPAGWVNRTTEREDKATVGKDWRSEAAPVLTVPSILSGTMRFDFICYHDEYEA